MMFRSVILIALLVTGFTGCGGGGGGDDSESGNARTGIRVVHSAIDAVPVDAAVAGDDGALLTRIRFSFPSQYGEVKEGAQTISLFRASRPGQAISSRQITVADGQRFTLAFFGDNLSFGLRTAIFDDTPGDYAAASGKIRVAHLATGAAELTARWSGLASSLEIPFGETSGYHDAPIGPVLVAIRRAADGQVLGSVQVNVEEGEAYSIFAVGEIGYYTALRLTEDTK
jgi:Domain of unknown function (DUF4397)